MKLPPPFFRGLNAGDAAVFAFALVAAAASFSAGDPESYFFPRLASVCLLLLCVLRAIAALRDAPPNSPKQDGDRLRRAAPAVIMLAAYLAIADWMGFYTAAGIAFFALSGVYAKNPRRGIFKRALLAAAVAAALFVVFAEIMGVQAPRGILI
jgi:hypothetical protein